MKTGRDLTQLATELQRQLKSKRDYVADTKALSVHPHITGMDELHGQPAVIVLDGLNGGYRITDYCHGQIAARLKIPKPYYDRMRLDHPELLMHNVNAWFIKTPERRMVRTMDGKARAFLSDRFRPIDNWDLAEVVLPKLAKAGCQVQSCELTETRMYIKAVTPNIKEEFMVPGSHGRVREVVQAGMTIKNSEVGAGSVEISPLLYWLTCLNGLQVEDATLRKYHIGRVTATEQLDTAVEMFSRRTLQADNKAFFMKVSDIVTGTLNQDTFRKLINRVKDTANHPIVKDPVKLVEDVTERFQLSEDEQGGVLKHLISGGNLTQYGLMNAVTRASQDVPDYDRATELEAVGGRILGLDPHEWSKLAA